MGVFKEDPGWVQDGLRVGLRRVRVRFVVVLFRIRSGWVCVCVFRVQGGNKLGLWCT